MDLYFNNFSVHALIKTQLVLTKLVFMLWIGIQLLDIVTTK